MQDTGSDQPRIVAPVRRRPKYRQRHSRHHPDAPLSRPGNGAAVHCLVRLRDRHDLRGRNAAPGGRRAAGAPAAAGSRRRPALACRGRGARRDARTRADLDLCHGPTRLALSRLRSLGADRVRRYGKDSGARHGRAGAHDRQPVQRRAGGPHRARPHVGMAGPGGR